MLRFVPLAQAGRRGRSGELLLVQRQPGRNRPREVTPMSRPNAASLDWCHRCMADTPTVYIQLSDGAGGYRVGNCCSVCRATRKGRPFVPRSFMQSNPPKPRRAVGAEHANPSR